MVPALESGAVDAAILSEPFPTLAEEKGIAVRPLTKAPGAKPVPITAIFWNKEWAAANPDLANRVMVAYPKAARDLALGDGWQGDKTLDVIVKFTPAKPEVLKKARPHALDANLEMDASVLDSMQKFNAELGYLKYKELQPVGKLFNFAYRDRAVQELGRK
jgi:ABC-type nitrate/sulfonate/bicarbonate transport system substrate-binding protein